MSVRTVSEKYRQFADLGHERFDVLVVGGGITGAGAARDLALRGLRVALVERADFGFGTSSRSTKLIHGGLRYLAQLAFGLVFESCRERHILQRIAPHLVRPLPLMIPLYRGAGRSPITVRCGLLLYDLLALFRNTHSHRMLSAAEALRRQPVLDPEGLRGAALYWDCQMDDARLCLENVIAAREAGAVTVNYAEVPELLYYGGKVAGAVVRDTETGLKVDVEARTVVNATGPWLDRVCALDGDAGPKLRPTRGTHLLVPRISTAEEGLYLSAESDERLFFVLPWGEQSLIGTTDVDAPDPDRDAKVSEEEIAYLLESCRNYLPGVELQREDVVASFAGLRPLLVHSAEQPSQASREHVIFESPRGLLSIGGGKYTTYRSMAAELADRVVAKLGAGSRRAATDRILLPGGMPGAFTRYLAHQVPELSRRHALDPGRVKPLIERYGTRTSHLLSLVESDPSLAEPVAEEIPLLGCEVAYAACFEMARTVDDVLRRRTSLALQPGHGDTARAAIEGLLARWSSCENELS